MLLLDKLILQFSKLPRVGRRAGTRIAVSLLQDKTGKAADLASILTTAMERIHPCPVCGCLAESEVCEYCANPARANGQICIVRDFSDVMVLEKSGIFRGRYQIIGGLLSGADGITPDDLFVKNLPERIAAEKITEIIFALPNTMDGKMTQMTIAAELSGVNCTELASGVPMGGDLDYLDDGTLTLAFGGRKLLN